MILLESALELKELLKERGSHFKPRLFRIDELKRLDETPAEALHHDHQGGNATSVLAIDRMDKDALEVVVGLGKEGIDPVSNLLIELHWLKKDK